MGAECTSLSCVLPSRLRNKHSRLTALMSGANEAKARVLRHKAATVYIYCAMRIKHEFSSLGRKAVVCELFPAVVQEGTQCKQHPGEAAQFFCVTCVECCCRLCREKGETHWYHECLSASTAAEQARVCHAACPHY